MLYAFITRVGFPSRLAPCVVRRESSGRSSAGWSVTDDWNREYQNEHERDNESLWLVSNRLDRAARNMQKNSNSTSISPDDLWLRVMLDQIAMDENNEDEITKSDVKPDKVGASVLNEELMDHEIALLVRCNQDPKNFLISQGRLIPELTDAERFDLKQLLDTNFQPTDFFLWAVCAMFDQHRRSQRINGDDTTHSVLDGNGVAAWMEKCWGEPVGLHEPRVTRVLAQFGRAGFLTKDDFVRMYVSALTGGAEGSFRSLEMLAKQRSEVIQTVWQDLSRHGIISPAESERNMKLAELQKNNPDIMLPNILDECAFLDDEILDEGTKFTDRQGKSSYERVELIPAKNTPEIPLWMQDGEFGTSSKITACRHRKKSFLTIALFWAVFIDEASCIGCGQCVTTSPATFQMLDFNGRARTFMQRNSPDVKAAVAACPVDCMKYVSFDELKELELARDNGVDDDHRHFGYTAARGYIPTTPLHVARRDSDASHKSSFYQ